MSTQGILLPLAAPSPSYSRQLSFVTGTFPLQLPLLEAREDSTAPGRMGKPALHALASGDSCPCPKSLLFPPLPGKHPNLFHSSLELAREIPPSKDKVRSVQAGHLLRDSAKLTFKAARARVLAPPRSRSRLIHPGPVPTFQPAPRSERGFPGAMSAAHTVPHPVPLLNVQSNLKSVSSSDSSSHLHRTLLIQIKPSPVPRIFRGLSS